MPTSSQSAPQLRAEPEPELQPNPQPSHPASDALTAQVEALLSAPDAPAAFARFATSAHALGFTHVFAARLSTAVLTDLEPNPFVFVSPTLETLDNYVRDGFFANDPVMARARQSSRPFRWREVHAEMDEDQARTVRLFAGFGLTHGLCIPIDRARGVAGIVSLGRGAEFDLSRRALIELEVLSRHLFEIIDRLRDAAQDGQAPPTIRLTPRERAVLTLVSEGKTNWAIGEILQVSEYSVRDYMRAMADKLQTSNRTHTVVRAVQLGLIAV